MTEAADFLRRMAAIVTADPRYSVDAYLFVMSALDRAVAGLPDRRHVNGRELLAAIAAEGTERFGPMTASVFEAWGLKNSLDFGQVVFNMVQKGVLLKTEQDALEDFEDPQFFDNLFDSATAYRLDNEAGAACDQTVIQKG